MHTRILALAIGALALGQTALAADIDTKDAQYLQHTAQGLMTEVKMGTMAQKQAGDERVKQFGQRMVTDHGKDLDKLRALAHAKQVTLPDSPDQDQTREAGKLAKLSGAAFDREYVRYEMKDHKEDVEDNGRMMKKAADSDVKAFASAEYETVVAHRKAVDELHAQLGQ